MSKPSFSIEQLAEVFDSTTSDAVGFADVLVAMGALSRDGDIYILENAPAIEEGLAVLGRQGARA